MTTGIKPSFDSLIKGCQNFQTPISIEETSSGIQVHPSITINTVYDALQKNHSDEFINTLYTTLKTLSGPTFDANPLGDHLFYQKRSESLVLKILKDITYLREDGFSVLIRSEYYVRYLSPFHQAVQSNYSDKVMILIAQKIQKISRDFVFRLLLMPSEVKISETVFNILQQREPEIFHNQHYPLYKNIENSSNEERALQILHRTNYVENTLLGLALKSNCSDLLVATLAKKVKGNITSEIFFLAARQNQLRSLTEVIYQ